MKLPLPLLTAALACCLPPASSSFAQAPAASLPSAPAANPFDFSKYPTADTLWSHISDLKSRQARPGDNRSTVLGVIWQVHSAAAEFEKRYPDDPRKWDARLLEIETEASSLNFAGQSSSATKDELQALSDEKAAPDSVRGQARYELHAMSLHAFTQGDRSVTSASILGQVHRFAADFPAYPSLDVIKYKIAEMMNQYDPAASAALLKELAASGQGRVADEARIELATIERLKSPLDIRFTAVDGTPVDLASMRGKVVLLCFWATGPRQCQAAMPPIVSAYRRLHSAGLEVIGISLDTDKGALLNYIAANGMPWPEYFDGKGWSNAISSQLGIHALPTIWLMDKKGYVRATSNNSSGLEDQAQRLLAEQ